MKKTHMVALNLKCMRIPLVLCAFFSIIISATTLSMKAPSLSVGEDASVFFISSSNSVRSKNHKIRFLSLSETTPAKVSQSHAVISSDKHKRKEDSIAITTVKTAPSSDVTVSNATDYTLDIKSFMADTPSFLKKDFSVLITHTHTTESYTPSEKYNYIQSDTDRTLDKNYNMARVGQEIAETLKSKGIKVYHDTTINDYPSYNGSYNRSAANTTNAIKNDSSIKIVLDVHRDAVEGANGEKVKYNCTVNGENTAPVMLVVGSNLSGLEHTDWKSNLNFAATLQSHIQSLYPELMRPLNFRSQRFNQQLAPGAIIVEVGTNGNTLDEALLGAKYFAEGLADYIVRNS